MSSQRQAGRRVVVTGSSRGIGLALAEGFLAEGARVVVNSRSGEAALEAARRLGREAVGIDADVSTDEGAERLIARAVEELGGIDVLINNAGMNVVNAAVDLQPADWRRIIDLNLTGAFLCSQQAARVMLAQERGVILNIASMTAFAPFPRRVAYASSKAAMVMMTRVMAFELAPNVRVNAIAPGYVRTDMTETLSREGKLDFGALVARTPKGRLGEPEEVAKAALFLASDDADFISGETLLMDGGWTSYAFT